ncbi:MAG: alpha/beta hydrolase [Bacteroidales bacterium]|nr:alpha/beta hydrolase [Bacteroidales bacterium]
MENHILHGKAPYNIILLHGGPGAVGSLHGLATNLASEYSLIEHFQRGKSIRELTDDIRTLITSQASGPVILAGHSWGAWLSMIFASENPELVKALILISCPPLEEKYLEELMSNRENRATESQLTELENLSESVFSNSGEINTESFLKMAGIFEKIDSSELLPEVNDLSEPDPVAYNLIWQEASELRSSGKLLQITTKIQSPVFCIHGKLDPHPADGAFVPVKRGVRQCKSFLIENCGHYPWRERYGKPAFYHIFSEIMKQLNN